MTRRDYVLIAGTLAQVYADDIADRGTPRATEVFLLIVEALADTLAQDNPSFDRSRFLEACKCSL